MFFLVFSLFLFRTTTSLTDACTMLPFDNYDDLSCKVTGWYNDTKLPCNTYQAADPEDASFLYVPTGLTVTIYCPIRTVLIGASVYECKEDGFDPPIKITNTTLKIDPHPVCLGVDFMQSTGLCAADTLSRLPAAGSNYQLYSDANYVFTDQEYHVECQTGFSISTRDTDREIYGSCSQSGQWTIRGSECLGMCVPEVRYGGPDKNTITNYTLYTDLTATTELGVGLQPVGTEVNITISCEAGSSPTGVRSGEFTLTCSVANSTVREGVYAHSRYQNTVNCKRNCMVPALPEGRLIDPWTGLTLVPGTMTMMNGEDAARMICPAGTYVLGRVRLECYDGVITSDLPTCTRILQPCEAPLIENGIRDPYHLAPGGQYQLRCRPGYTLPVTTSPLVTCRELKGRVTDLGVTAAALTPASSYTCYSGCRVPISTLSHGSLFPNPSLSSTSAPYRTGQSITITCFRDESRDESRDVEHVRTCIWDGWDIEEWPDCAPSVPSGGISRITGNSWMITGVLTLALVVIVNARLL